MKLIIEQTDLIRALKGYVAHMGIPLENMEVSIDFKAGRKHPSYCVISVMEKEDSFEGVQPEQPISVVTDSSAIESSEEGVKEGPFGEIYQAPPEIKIEPEEDELVEVPAITSNMPFGEPSESQDEEENDNFALFP